jgi:hypothetical protein
MLSGDVEAQYSGNLTSPEQAQRLAALMPHTAQALVEHGPDLLDVFISGATLISRIGPQLHHAAWFERLQALARPRPTLPNTLDQHYLFEQYARVLHRLAERTPLLITLDDLQWADVGSISLLFHVGRRLTGARILVVGAYRPDEVALGRAGQRHPLEKVLTEFKRAFGDIQIDLAAPETPEARTFIDAYLDMQPNRLGKEFRQALWQQTGGHPLFTVELLRAMQERGDLIQAEDGRWLAHGALDWQTLPARVEGVIEERIGRLAPEQRELLAVASVEGEEFTAEVVAQAQQMSERQVLHILSQEFEARHRLVREQEVCCTARWLKPWNYFTSSSRLKLQSNWPITTWRRARTLRPCPIFWRPAIRPGSRWPWRRRYIIIGRRCNAGLPPTRLARPISCVNWAKVCGCWANCKKR